MGIGFGGFDIFEFGEFGTTGFDTTFRLVYGIVTVGFIIAIGSFVITALKRIMVWDENNHAPQTTISAVVISKRTDISYYRNTNMGDGTRTHGYHMTSNTYHYVTFEFDNGERKEFFVKGSEYGLLKEGDTGILRFQGTRYLGFQRNQ